MHSFHGSVPMQNKSAHLWRSVSSGFMAVMLAAASAAPCMAQLGQPAPNRFQFQNVAPGSGRPGAKFPSSYYVLAVGISKYQLPQLNLRGPANDAKAIAEMFRSQGRPARVDLLLDERATKAAIVQALDRAVAQASEDDLVIIYMSGHGDRRGGRWYFIPYDFDPNEDDKESQRGFLGNLSHSGVPDFQFGAAVQNLTAGSLRPVVLAIDSCFAGTMKENLSRQIFGDFSNSGLSQVTLLASSIPSEFSIDNADNGLFTTALLEGLRGKADVNNDGTVSMKELKLYISWRMGDLVRESPKLPGVSWPEQNAVCVSSYFFEENVALTNTLERRPAPVFGNPAPASPDLSNPFAIQLYNSMPSGLSGGGLAAANAPIGTWFTINRFVNNDGTPIVRKDGKPVQSIYALELRPDRKYVATFRDIWDKETTTSGQYLFRPKLAGLELLAQNKGENSLEAHNWLTLEFGNGSDLLRLDILPDGSMKLTNSMIKPERSFVLQRLTEPPQKP